MPEVCGFHNGLDEVGNDGNQKMALDMVHLKYQVTMPSGSGCYQKLRGRVCSRGISVREGRS